MPLSREEAEGGLIHLFPDADPLTDWILVDSKGPRGVEIAQWNRPEPQPNEGQIKSVTLEQRDRANKNARFKRDLESSNKDEALITWIAGKHGLTYQQALDEIKVIFEGL